MPWLRFDAPFRWSPSERKGAVTIKYRKGGTYLVTTPCAEGALSAGAARRTVAPRRKKRDADAGG